MKKFNILVTGISAVSGYGVAEALSLSKYECTIIGVNVYDKGAGEQWCDVVERGPFAESEYFPEFIYDMIVKHDIDLVIPTVEEENRSLMKRLDLYSQLNAKFVLNNQDMFKTLDDKYLTYKLFKDQVLQIPTIHGHKDLKYDEVVERIGSPFVLKKTLSYGSKDVVTIHELKDFDYWSYKYSEGYICQKNIVGEEYTISVFGTEAGEYVNMIALSRTLMHGITITARCIQPDPAMIDYVEQICQVISPIGPTNIQLIQEGENYLLLEVNTRISASTSIRTRFGVNEAEMCIEYFLLNMIPDKRVPKTGSAIRYLKDWVEYDSTSV